MSSVVRTLSRDAWSRVMSFLMLAELGSFPVSWLASFVGDARLAQAVGLGGEPVQVELDVKSPRRSCRCQRAVPSSTGGGVTETLPTVTENGVWKSSPWPLTWWTAIGVEALLDRRGNRILGLAGSRVEVPDAGADVGVGAPPERVDDVRVIANAERAA